MAHITLINPAMVTQKGDFFGTGIPYMPLELVQLATYLNKKRKHTFYLIDAFGEATLNTRKTKTHYIQGLSVQETLKRIPQKTDLVLIYAGRLFNHDAAIELVTQAKLLGHKVAVLENSQAVTAYSLQKVAKEFFSARADFLITGEAEYRVQMLLDSIDKGYPTPIEGIITKEDSVMHQKKAYIKEVDGLPFPDWSLIPLKNYWRLGVAHAPLSSRRWLPLQTSRGCPYPCTFCVIPSTNERTWRHHSPKYVVDEMELNIRRFGVQEFHIEDLNPGILKKRIEGICDEILKRKLVVNWKICSGTKIEHLDTHSIELMAKAGCSYISISPESGSPHILKLMDKYFDHKYALEMIAAMHRYGITSQACFVLGHPGEKKEDLALTKEYIQQLAKAGADEIALFILTPVPGSKIYETFKGPKELSKMTFSPTWRKDYSRILAARKEFYKVFALAKLRYHPIKVLKQPLNILTRKFNTKMEMTPYRLLTTAMRAWRAKEAKEL